MCLPCWGDNSARECVLVYATLGPWVSPLTISPTVTLLCCYFVVAVILTHAWYADVLRVSYSESELRRAECRKYDLTCQHDASGRDRIPCHRVIVDRPDCHEDDEEIDIYRYDRTPFLYSTNATLGHQDNMSLMLMIRSMEIARYLSGIRPIVLLFSSSIRYTRLSISLNARSLYLPWFDRIPPNEVLKASIRMYEEWSVSAHTIRPLAIIRGQRNCERDPIIQHNTTQPCGWPILG